MILVTGASDNHFKTLNQFIDVFLSFYHGDNSILLIVYNLGINEEKWNDMKNKYNYENITYKVFNYSLYPDYLNININAGEYAWKSVIIYDTCEEYNDLVVWMDSGNLIYEKIDKIYDHLSNHYVYCEYSASDVQRWTHPGTLAYLNCREEILYKGNRNGACIGFNYKIDWVKSLVGDYKKYSLIKDCIAPEGSSRENHRQDQSVFTILFYQYQEKYHFIDMQNFDFINHGYLGYRIHNDID